MLAHSARPDRGISKQAYSEHVCHVSADAVLFAERVAKYAPKFGRVLRDAVALAAEYHDLGKLDDENQKVLSSASKNPLPITHWDAGSAHLMSLAKSNAQELAFPLSAALVLAHHEGLISLKDARVDASGRFFRVSDRTKDGRDVRQITDGNLAQYLQRHREELSQALLPQPTLQSTPIGGRPPALLFRLALSCLVDADHSDTAANYRDAVARDGLALNPEQRLATLDSFVRGLGHGKSDARSALRDAVYQACRDADAAASIYECDSPVGTGKTTAVMAHLLQVAREKGLRRVFVVLPFTNIINQSVKIYRKSLLWPGENPADVVAAHHHRVQFEAKDARLYAFLWHAPVVVTTAVQFFETLASNQPSALRKLHQLPGSAIFIDEAHAALPAHLWPVAWKWLRQLADDWSCHVVLGSGSLNRIWTLEEFVKPKVELPPLVKPEVRATSVAVERERIVPRTSPEPVGLDELTSWLPELPGPRLLILNTVQSAAAIARRLAEKFGRKNVEHLSTALAPIHRERSLQRIERRLARKRDRDWTLVATSCVEAGVDFSFRTGLRERCSLVSFIQTGGRVNRNGEYGESELWDFQLRPDVFLRPHPAFEDSAFVFGKMFAEGRVTPEFCTDALKRVLEIEGPKKAADELLKADAIGNFPFVAKEFRVIAQDTVTVVVSQKLVRRIETVRGYRPTPNELQDASVQIWSNKVAAWKPRPIQRMPELFAWTLRYDKFLGIMLGALELIEGGETGFIV